MLIRTFARCTAIGLLVLASACGDDSGGSDADERDAATDPSGKTGDGGSTVGRPDGGTDLDATVELDGALIIDSDGSVSADGAVTTEDGGTLADSAVGSDIDAAPPDAATPTQDAASAQPDASTSPADASTAADAAIPVPDAGCDVFDDRFGGCGRVVGDSWVRFESGYEVDRDSKLVWSPVITPDSDVALTVHCHAIPPIDNLTHIFDIPTMEQVRTLAAGCDATVSGGSCAVNAGDAFGQVLPSAAGQCSCPGAAPEPTGFCRPEVSSCDTLWTRTFCGPNAECSSYQHWFYDVSDGSIGLAGNDDPIAIGAKGRCVTAYLEIM